MHLGKQRESSNELLLRCALICSFPSLLRSHCTHGMDTKPAHFWHALLSTVLQPSMLAGGPAAFQGITWHKNSGSG